TYDNSRWESYEPPELALHLLHDQGERPFLLLTGPEPDHEWDLFSRAVLTIAARLDTGPAISFLGIPAGMPHTRPLGVIAHATRLGGPCGRATAGARPGPGCRAARRRGSGCAGARRPAPRSAPPCRCRTTWPGPCPRRPRWPCSVR